MSCNKLFLTLIIIFFFSISNASATQNKTVDTAVVLAQSLKIGAVGVGDDLLKDSNISEEGNVNVFEGVIKAPDYYNQPDTMQQLNDTIPGFIIIVKVLILLLGMFCLFQAASPTSAANMTKYFNQGRATYIAPLDILKFGVGAGLWFMVGPTLLFAMMWHCSELVQSMDTSVLSEVVLSSSTVSNYLIFALVSKAVNIYFAIRGFILIYATIGWYYIGLITLYPKTRWIGILAIIYTAVQIYIQVIIVAALITSVQSIYHGNMAWWENMTSLCGMVIIVFCCCVISFFSPFIVEFLRPGATNNLINIIKGVVL
jgi:hypothetical protein